MPSGYYEIQKYTQLIGFPEEAIAFFQDMEKRVSRDTKLTASIDKHIDQFMVPGTEFSVFRELSTQLTTLLSVSSYSVDMFLLLAALPNLTVRYTENSLSQELFQDTMTDLRYKLFECKSTYDEWGNFVAFWYPGFYQVQRFALGRFQYERDTFAEESFTQNGLLLQKGDPVINFHIPTCGPMPRDLRLSSYEKAYRFFGTERPDGYLPFVCHSWLLFQGHREFLTPDANIVSFMEDFTILRQEPQEKFHDAWRVFGSQSKKPMSEWPSESSLQKGYLRLLQSGGKSAWGYGVFFYKP